MLHDGALNSTISHPYSTSLTSHNDFSGSEARAAKAIRKGAEVNKQIGARIKSARLSDVFLFLALKVNYVDADGKAPLHYASKHGVHLSHITFN